MNNTIKTWVFNKDYKNPNITPEMIALVRPHKEMTYNSQIVDAIGMDENCRDNLETLVYLCRKLFRQEAKAEMENKMIAEGWLPIPSYDDEVMKPFAYRGAITIKAIKEQDWCSSRIDSAGKIISDCKGKAFFVPKGKRTRGYYFQSLKGYYKTTN